MNSFLIMVAVAAASATLGVVALAAAPAKAQGWQDDGPPPGWHDRNWHSRDPYGREDDRPGYGYRDPYAREDDRPSYGYGVDTGITDIAICPPGYHLGHSGGLCWPN